MNMISVHCSYHNHAASREITGVSVAACHSRVMTRYASAMHRQAAAGQVYAGGGALIRDVHHALSFYVCTVERERVILTRRDGESSQYNLL